MNNPIVKIVKFLSIFSIFVAMAIVYEINFNSLNTTTELELFNSGNTDHLCGNKKTIQVCFRHQIGNIFNKSTPIMIYHILGTHQEIFKRTQRIRGAHEKDIYNYVKNWNIILDNLSSFYLSTDRLHFFQILILPIIKTHIRITLVKAKSNIQNIINQNKILLTKKTKIELEKLNKFKVDLIKGRNNE